MSPKYKGIMASASLLILGPALCFTHEQECSCHQGNGQLKTKHIPLILLLVLPVVCAVAQIVNDAPRPCLTVPEATMAPMMTANSEDFAWKSAVVIPTLTPSLRDGPALSVIPETKVQVLWDRDWLYVRFLCKGGKAYMPVRGHDAPLYRGDAVEVFLDPAGDSRQWVELQFNAAGDSFEKLFLCTGEPRTDPSLRMANDVILRDVWDFPAWDLPGLRNAAARWKSGGEDVGWIVDVAIPAHGLLKRLGKDHFEPMTLRADFLRYEWPEPAAPGKERTLVSLNWSPVSYGGPHRSPAAYGYLDLEKSPNENKR